MQSHLVFSAEKKVAHEFLLASIAIKAVHKMHRPGVRTEDTMSQVFAILAKGQPVNLPQYVKKTSALAHPVQNERLGKQNMAGKQLPTRF